MQSSESSYAQNEKKKQISRKRSNSSSMISEEQSQSQDLQNDDFCFKCKAEGNLYCCDNCFRTFHGPGHKMNDEICLAVDPGDNQWICPICTGRNNCVQCERTIEKGSQRIMTCTVCYRFTHANCTRLPEKILSYREQYDQFLKGDFLVCYNCLMDSGIRKLILTEVFENKVYHLVIPDKVSNIHRGWLSDDQLNKVLIKNRRRRDYKTNEPDFIMVIDRIIAMKRPLIHKHISIYEEISILRDSCRIVEYGNPNNFKFLIKWFSGQYQDSTWEDEYVARCNPLEFNRFLALKQFEIAYLIQKTVPLKNFRSITPSFHDQPYYFSSHKAQKKVLQLMKQIIHFHKDQRNIIMQRFEQNNQRLAVIGFINYCYYSQNMLDPILIITRQSQIQTWHTQLKKWSSGLNIILFTGESDNRNIIKARQLFYKSASVVKFNVMITTFEILNKQLTIFDNKEIKVKWFKLILDDEGRLYQANRKMLLNSFGSVSKIVIFRVDLHREQFRIFNQILKRNSVSNRDFIEVNLSKIINQSVLPSNKTQRLLALLLESEKQKQPMQSVEKHSIKKIQFNNYTGDRDAVTIKRILLNSGYMGNVTNSTLTQKQAQQTLIFPISIDTSEQIPSIAAQQQQTSKKQKMQIQKQRIQEGIQRTQYEALEKKIREQRQKKEKQQKQKEKDAQRQLKQKIRLQKLEAEKQVELKKKLIEKSIGEGIHLQQDPKVKRNQEIKEKEYIENYLNTGKSVSKTKPKQLILPFNIEKLQKKSNKISSQQTIPNNTSQDKSKERYLRRQAQLNNPQANETNIAQQTILNQQRIQKEIQKIMTFNFNTDEFEEATKWDQVKRIAFLRFVLMFGTDWNNKQEFHGKLQMFQPKIFKDINVKSVQQYHKVFTGVLLNSDKLDVIYVNTYCFGMNAKGIQRRILEISSLKKQFKRLNGKPVSYKYKFQIPHSNINGQKQIIEPRQWGPEQDYRLIKLTLDFGVGNWTKICCSPQWSSPIAPNANYYGMEALIHKLFPIGQLRNEIDIYQMCTTAISSRMHLIMQRLRNPFEF